MLKSCIAKYSNKIGFKTLKRHLSCERSRMLLLLTEYGLFALTGPGCIPFLPHMLYLLDRKGTGKMGTSIACKI